MSYSGVQVVTGRVIEFDGEGATIQITLLLVDVLTTNGRIYSRLVVEEAMRRIERPVPVIVADRDEDEEELCVGFASDLRMESVKGGYVGLRARVRLDSSASKAIRDLFKRGCAVRFFPIGYGSTIVDESLSCERVISYYLQEIGMSKESS